MKTIDIKITCSRKVDYERTVKVTESQYETLKGLMGDDISISNSKVFFTLDGLIDGNDIVNADDKFLDVTVGIKHL